MEVIDYKAIQEDPALRRGLYGLGELTSYLSFRQAKPFNASTVARWAQHGLSAVQHQPRRPDYSFADLISMLVVRNLIGLGFSPADVRSTETYLRARYGHEHPFVSVRLKTDGVDVFYEAAPAMTDQLTAANRGGQEVIRPAITGALRGVNYTSGLAASWAPADGIVLDPTVQFGEPCVADTRMPTAQLAQLAGGEETSAEELARVYRIDETAVRRALQFERDLALAS